MENKYTVTAYDARGNRVHSEGMRTVAQARKTARQFMPYANVYTVDIDRKDQLAPVVRLVKLTPNSGVSIADGTTKTIRF